MPRCAFLTTDDLDEYIVDDRYAADALRDRGWRVDDVVWHDRSIRWDGFDVVVIRSTWDYHHRLEEFLNVLATIDRSDAALENRFPLIRWNAHKRYLRDLEEAGFPIVSTVWYDRLEVGQVEELFDELGAGEIVVKPAVGAGADDLFRLERGADADLLARIERTFADRPLLAQPFVPEVARDGEYSLCYFGGRFAHAVRKVPAERDFRVQEERGAEISRARPDPELRTWGSEIVRALEEHVRPLDRPPLYARVDLILTDEGPLLMELELIEPALYFRTHPPAARRFADALTLETR